MPSALLAMSLLRAAGALGTASARRGATLVRATAPLGQDLAEQFEVYEAPKGGVGVPLARGAEPSARGVRKARGDVHRDGDWHRSVHVWLSDGAGNLLLQQRSEHKDTFPWRWDVSCAGHITAGDTSVESAVRELQEELGLALEPSVLAAASICTMPAEMRGATEAHGPFLCREYQDIYLVRMGALAPERLGLGLDEVAAVRLLPASEVLAAWAREDPSFVPRGAPYRRMLARALEVEERERE